jgi:hypothetical protein
MRNPGQHDHLTGRYQNRAHARANTGAKTEQNKTKEKKSQNKDAFQDYLFIVSNVAFCSIPQILTLARAAWLVQDFAQPPEGTGVGDA